LNQTRVIRTNGRVHRDAGRKPFLITTAGKTVFRITRIGENVCVMMVSALSVAKKGPRMGFTVPDVIRTTRFAPVVYGTNSGNLF
jgi:hypothetical protein